MFTGIVADAGTVLEVAREKDVVAVRIDAGRVGKGLRPGDSIAVNGCCLTAVTVERSEFTCHLTTETLARTSFAATLRPGARVNLERPMPAAGRFDGHIVQGHVDGVGKVVRLDRAARAATLAVSAPAGLLRYLVEKGSITVDGVSLTVASLRGRVFTVALIPYTLERTNLHAARPGARVNLEVDVIAKYVERLMMPPPRRAPSKGTRRPRKRP